MKSYDKCIIIDFDHTSLVISNKFIFILNVIEIHLKLN